MANILDFRDPLGVPPPKGETLCLGPICTIIQNFSAIGVTITKVSVTEQIHTTTADLILALSDIDF